MTKQGPRRLKIGVQSRFGPNSTVEFEAVFRKIFGVAYSIWAERKRMSDASSRLHLSLDVAYILWLSGRDGTSLKSYIS